MAKSLVLPQLQAGDDFVERAVPAAGDNKVRLPGVGTGKGRRVTALFRDIDGTAIIRTVEDRDDLRQKTPGLAGAGIGIDDQEKCFQTSLRIMNESLQPG